MNKQSEFQNDEFIEELYRDTYKILFNFLLRRTYVRQDAQDLSQEAYLRLIRVKKKELILQPKAYLFQIAANLVREQRIKKLRSVESSAVSIEDAENQLTGTELEQDNDIIEALKSIENIIHGLPPIYRSVILLRKRDGLSHEEIAQKLDISIHTVRKYMTRAITMCRKQTAVENDNE